MNKSAASRLADSTSPPLPQTKTPPRQTDDHTAKETFQSIVIALILAFVFRAYVVEAFVIPTGSMAPTLLGEHLNITCQECGYQFTIDAQNRPKSIGQRYADTVAICPMCHFPNPLSARATTSGGDRILVHKYIYNLVEPSRFDVVVFKEPAKPTENFIKRLVGLPGESLWVIEGNIYVKSNTGSDGWHIARKTNARLGYTTQRDLWQPVYHSQFVPLDEGRSSLQRQIGDFALTWQTPWSADQPANWHIANQRSYTHPTAKHGRITFDFQKTFDPQQTNWFPYNQFHPSSWWNAQDPLIITEDIRLAATFEPEEKGLGITLSTQARMTNPDPEAPPDRLEAHISPNGQAWLQSIAPDGQVTMLTDKVAVTPFAPHQGTQVELWYVDQEAILWYQGHPVLKKQFDIPMDTIINRPPLENLPVPMIDVQGSPVTLHQVEVDRDVYYTSTLSNRFEPGRGAMVKTGHTHLGEPVTLGPDQFFCMGDNSPMSSDGRFWTSVNPWVAKQMIDPNAQQVGIVPRQLMMGRAFFVYFPAAYGWGPTSKALIPNFGQMRFIH